MTAVPYTFANQTGNIPLSQLDDNFATLANAVPAYADAAGIATVATSAGSAGTAATVTANAQANITSVGTLTFLDVTGNVSANYFIGNGSALTGVSISSLNAGNLTGNTLSSNVVNSSLTTVGNLVGLSVTGNVQTSNLNVLQDLDVTGVGYIYNISSTGTAFLTTLTAATVSTTGNISTANSVIATGNVQAGNLRTSGIVSATGNITGNFIFGNGSQLTGIDATSIQNGTANVRAFLNGNVTASAGGVANVLNITSTGTITTGTITATGNITGGNLQTAGLISATGNVNTSNNVIATGNISANNISSNTVTAPDIVTNFIRSDDSTEVFVDDDVTVTGDLDVIGGLRVFGAPFRLPSFTSAEIANIAAVNGDMVYNATLNKFQGYENGGWANII